MAGNGTTEGGDNGTDSGAAPGLLTGLQVLDFSQFAFGPVATRLLADLGADVIKVEPLEGDFSRLTAEPFVDSITFICTNLNKRSFSVNLKDERGLEAVKRLCERADVLVENFRPGTMDRMGLGYEELSKINPGLVYGSFSMFGESGPLSHRRGGDMWAQAFAGFVTSQTDPDGDQSPWVNGHNVIDYGGGAVNAYSLMAALWHRERTGRGQKVTNNLVNTAVLMQWPAIAHYLSEGIEFRKEGRGGVRSRFPYAAYPASDGYVLTIFGQDDTEWRIVCEILEIEDVLDDPRYDTVEKRNAARLDLYPVLDEAFSKHTREEWQDRFRARQLRCDPCLNYEEFTEHGQFLENSLAVTVDDPRDGELVMPASPVRFSDFPPPKTARHSPILGEHTEEVLAALGYDGEEIEILSEEGAVGVPLPDMFTAQRQLVGKDARQRGVFKSTKLEREQQQGASS